MKIRLGFVSNSSSSSFCLIGLRDSRLLGQLCKKEGIILDDDSDDDSDEGSDEYLYGVEKRKVLTFVGSEGECNYAGLEAEPLLKTCNIPEACKKVRDLIKEKFDIDVPLAKIGFYYGEIS